MICHREIARTQHFREDYFFLLIITNEHKTALKCVLKQRNKQEKILVKKALMSKLFSSWLVCFLHEIHLLWLINNLIWTV